MRRRLDLAASLVGRPSVIFLDEPSTGLDPHSRLTMWQVIAGLAASGVTIFLTTQYLEEADRLADRIAVLDAGRLVAEGTAAELKQRFAGRRLDLTCPDTAALARLSRYLGDRVVHLDPADLTVGVATDGSAAQVRAGPRPAGCRRSGPGPGYGLRRARRRPRRRFPHPDRTCNGDRSCLTP
jgi:ABC-2 type transport system ATP-binding protein